MHDLQTNVITHPLFGSDAGQNYGQNGYVENVASNPYGTPYANPQLPPQQHNAPPMVPLIPSQQQYQTNFEVTAKAFVSLAAEVSNSFLLIAIAISAATSTGDVATSTSAQS